MNNKRVFIIGPGNHVYDAALKFGERVDVLDSKANPFDTDELTATVVHKLRDLGFHEDDFIVLGGNAVLNVLAVGILVEQFGFINLLVYGAKHQDYTPRTVKFTELIDLVS